MMGIESILEHASDALAQETTRRGFFRSLGAMAAAALVSCASPKRYDLVYGYSRKLQHLEDMKPIIGDLLNVEKNLKIIPTYRGDYALLHDIDDPSKEHAEKVLAHLYTRILQDSDFFGPSIKVGVVESGSLERRKPKASPHPSLPDDHLPINPGSIQRLDEVKRKVLGLMFRAVDRLRGEGFDVSREYIPLFMAITEAESNFSAEQERKRPFGIGAYGDISRAGAVGYMQLMPFNVPDDMPAIRMRKGEGNRAYAYRLLESARGKSLEELARLDVRFDPYQGIYYGIKEFMDYMNGFFSVGDHTYYKGRRYGGELRGRPSPGMVTHKVDITPEDRVIYSCAAYNWGAYAAMGFIVDKKVGSGEELLQLLRTSGIKSYRSRAGYVSKIVRRTADYRATIGSPPWAARR